MDSSSNVFRFVAGHTRLLGLGFRSRTAAGVAAAICRVGRQSQNRRAIVAGPIGWLFAIPAANVAISALALLTPATAVSWEKVLSGTVFPTLGKIVTYGSDGVRCGAANAALAWSVAFASPQLDDSGKLPP